MSSFKRRVQSQVTSLKGTRPVSSTPSLLQISTGIPSLDDLLGGGLPLGHCALILAPDIHSSWGELISRYYIAQGLSNEQDLLVVDDKPSRLVEGCMWHAGSAAPQVSQNVEEKDPDDTKRDEEGGVKIAWRYEQMKQFRTTVDDQDLKNDEYCRTFDLATSIPPDLVANAISADRLLLAELNSNMESGPYEACLKLVETFVAKNQSRDGEKIASRICINGLGGYKWGKDQPSIILQFLLRLRAIVRGSTTSILIAMASYTSAPTFAVHWIPKLAQLSDACFTFQGTTSDPVLGPIFPSYSGLLTVHTTPSPHTLLDPSRRFSQLRGLSNAGGTNETGRGENNLAFKCMRKRFVIETLHLDVEGGVGERRTEPVAGLASITSSTTPIHQNFDSAEPSLSDRLAKVAIEGPNPPVSISPQPEPTSATIPSSGNAENKPKKPRKKVAFQSADSALYDF